MLRLTPLVVLVGSLTLWHGHGVRPGYAQQKAEESTAVNAEDVKAVRYLEVLRRRPEPGYLFDRFYNTWLDQSTVDELQRYLTARVAESQETGDRLLLAFFYVKQGDDVAALQEFRAALENDPGSAATWFHKALVEARTLDFDTAIDDLRKARERQPDEKLAPRIDKELGKLLVRNGKTQKALAVWRELLAAYPYDEELQEDMIELHLDENLFEEAAKLAEDLIAKTNDPYLVVTRRLRLGDIHQRSGSRSKALEVYNSALEQVGFDSWLEREVLGQIEQVFRREDDLTGLNAHYADLREEHGKRVAIHRRHAQLLAEMGEADAAIQAFQEILQLTPGDRDNREQYVSLLARLDRRDQAVEELEALCEQYAQDAELRFRLATLRHEAGQIDDVADEVNRYLELSDTSEYAYLRGARLLERLEKVDEARQIYEKMAAAHPDSASAKEALAAFLYNHDEKQEALAIWHELAAATDLNGLLHVTRGLTSRGEHQAAFDMLVERRENFQREPLYLAQLVSSTIALKEYEKAIPWALERVARSETVTDLESAIDQAVLVCERADKLEEVVQELASRPRRLVSETCLLAQLWEEHGDSPAADAAVAEPVAAGEILAVSQQIRIFSQRRDWAAAADATRRILELPGGQKSLHVRRLVELYSRDYQIKEALSWIETWKRLSPGSAAPWLAEARLLRMEGKQNDALVVLRKACQRFEEDEDLRAKLAQAYTESEMLGDAERIYWQLYDQTEDLFGKLRWVGQLARLSEQQGKTQQLVENLEERARTNRRSLVPLLSLAEIYREVDDYEGRRRALTAATKVKPDDPQLLMQIARIEESEGDWRAALATLEKAAELDKTNSTREKIAKLHLEYGDPEDGYAILYDLAGGEQSDPRVIEAIADAMCNTSEWQRAADFLRERVDQHPKDYRLRYLYGVALEEAGQTDAAVDVYLSLLRDQEELPGKAQPAMFGQSVGSYLDMLKQMAPQQAGEWLQLTQYRHTVYQYQQQRQGGGAVLTMSLHGASGGLVNIPRRVEDLHSYALTHLITLAGLMSDEGSAEIAERMESNGIEDAHIVLKLGTDQNGMVSGIDEVLDDNPRHESALALHVIRRLGQQQIDSGERNAIAFEVFRDSYPQLAVMAAVQAAAQDEKYAPLLDEAMELAEDVESPSPLALVALVTSVGGPPFQQQLSTALDDNRRQQILKVLIDWYPHMQRSPQYATWSFLYLVGALAQAAEPEPYIAFLEDEVARTQSSGLGLGAQHIASMFGHGQNNGLIAPLEFPPRQLADFPAHVLAMLSDSDPNRNPFSNYVHSIEGRWDEAKVLECVKKVKHPILRTLLARQLGADTLVEETLQEMLGAEQPRPDAYLLAAARACDKENEPQAVELLEKVRYLPMSREIREQVDAALVSLALNVDGHSESSEEIRDAGRQAALRLRRGRLNADHRNELIVALDQLGLKQEAEKLEQVASTAPTYSPASATAMYSASTATRNVQNDRVARLMEEGKKEMACKLLAREVIAEASNLANNIHNFPYRRQQSNQIAERVRSFALENEVLAALDPGESTNPARLITYASACDLFGKTTEAQAAFERYLERRPKDDNTRMLLVMLLAESNSESATAHLEALSDSASQTMGQALANSMQYYQTPLDERLALARIAYRYFSLLKDRERSDISWVEYLVQMLARQMQTRGSNLPSLYAPRSSGDSRPAGNEEIDKKRRELHEQFCREMLDVPQTARAGFSHLLAVTEAQGDDALEAQRGELTQLAMTALLLEAKGDPRRANLSQMVYYSSSNPSEVRFRSPEEFLVRQAWKDNNWQELEDSLLPELGNGREKEPHDALLRYMELYQCEPQQFVDVAENVVRQIVRVNRRGTPDTQAISAVIDAWIDRDLSQDIEELVLRQVEQSVKSPNHHQPCDFLLSYLQHIGRERDIDHTLALLDKVATLYVGPAARRADFIKRHYQPNMISWGSPNGNIYVFRQTLQRLLQDEHLVFVTIRHMEPYGQALMVDNMQYYFRSALQRLRTQVTDESLKTLEQCSWLEDLDKFQPLEFAAEPGNSLLEILLGAIGSNEELRKDFQQQLNKRHKEKPTFGTGLVLAAISQKNEPASFLEYLGQHVTALRAQPQERQAALASVLASGVSKDADRGTLSDAATTGKEWLETHQARHARQQADELLKARRLEELGIEYYNTDEYLARRIPELLADDPVAARIGFVKVCELAEESRRRGQWHYSYSDGETLRGRLLAGMLRRGDYGRRSDSQTCIRTLAFVVDLLASEEGREIEINQQATIGLQQYMQQAFQKVREETRSEKLNSAQAARRLYDLLTGELGNRPATVLLGPTADLLWHQVNDHDRPQVREWLEEIHSENPAAPSTRDWQAALALAEAARGGRPRTPPGDATERADPADHHTHLISMLDDTGLSPGWRMHVAHAILEHEGIGVPLEVALACVRVYNEALAAKTPIPSFQQRLLLDLALSLTDEETDPDSSYQVSHLIATCRDEWAARYLRHVRINRRLEDDPHLITDNGVLCRALKLYLVAEDRERVEEFIRYHESPLGANRMALALLVRHGKHELAVKLLRSSWNRLDVHHMDSNLVAFDERLQNELPKFIEQQQSDDARYLAEVFVASLSDSPIIEGGHENRNARLVRLAGRYDAVQFGDDAHRNRVLEVFTTETEAGLVVADAIAQRYAELDLLAAARNNDHQQLQQMLHLVKQHCRNRFRAGDPQPLVETIDKFSKFWAGDEYYLGQATEPLVQCTFDSLREDGSSWTQEQCAAVAKALRQILTGRDHLYLNYFRKYNTVVLLTHARSGAVGELQRWYQALGDNSRSWMRDSHLEGNVWEVAGRLFSSSDGNNLSERTEFLRNVVVAASKLNWLRWQDHRPIRLQKDSNLSLVDEVVNNGLLSPEEVTEVALDLVEGEQLGEKYAFLLGGPLASWFDAQGQHDAAVMLWRKAINAVPEDEPVPLAYARLSLSQALEAAGDAKQAKVELSRIDEEHLPAQSRQQYQKLKEKFAEPNSKAEEEMTDRGENVQGQNNKSAPEPQGEHEEHETEKAEEKTAA